MNRVNIATLKEKLSHYLKLVAGGQQVVVTSHKHPVAKIVPAHGIDVNVRPPLRLPSELRKVKGIRRPRSVSAVHDLIKDRRSR